MIDLLISHKANTKLKDEEGKTAFDFAVAGRFANLMFKFGGEKPNLEAKDAVSFLNIAISNQDMELVKKFMKLVKDINAKGDGDETPLGMAVETKNFALCELILKAGANIEVLSGPNDHSPLLYAVIGGDVEMVKYLLSKGADPNAMNGDIIESAKYHKQTEILKLLEKAKKK